MPVGKIRTEEHTLADHRLNFPALANKAYFNYGGQGVLSRMALDEIHTSFEFVQREGPFNTRMFGWIEDELSATRQSLVSELGGDESSYAILGNATEACNTAMWGIEWQPGDHLILTDSEHIGIVAIAEQIAARRGVKLTYLKVPENGIADAFEAAFQTGTKMVVLSQVLWTNGRVLPIVEIQERCRKANIRLLVDAAQSAGVIPLDLNQLDIDFFAITGHKWLCGPEGMGALYIRPQLIEELKPTFAGWRSSMIGESKQPTAARFEVATCPFPLLTGLRTAIKVHQQWGSAEERFQQLLHNVRALREGLASNSKIDVITPENEQSGLVSFTVADHSPWDVLKMLDSHRVFLRTIPGVNCLRASVHYLTDNNDIQNLLDVLSSAS